jgi:hypothetical protein
MQQQLGPDDVKLMVGITLFELFASVMALCCRNSRIKLDRQDPRRAPACVRGHRMTVQPQAEELELRQASAKDGIVSMNTEEFKKFAFMPNRPYHLALFFVAKQLWDHPRTQLREVRKEYGYAADAFQRGSNPQKIVFVDLNLDKAQEVFQLLGIEHLPFIVHWPPSITTNDLGKSGGKALVSESNKFGKGIQKYPYPAGAPRAGRCWWRAWAG